MMVGRVRENLGSREMSLSVVRMVSGLVCGSRGFAGLRSVVSLLTLNSPDLTQHFPSVNIWHVQGSGKLERQQERDGKMAIGGRGQGSLGMTELLAWRMRLSEEYRR